MSRYQQLRVNALTGLCLIATGKALSTACASIQMVSMPSRAYASLLRTGNSPLRSKDLVSMPSRAYASLLQYPFKNLGFMRFPEPVFAGICQNILTVAHFHACLQFGHIL